MGTILHVVDADLARGAQRGAQLLRDALDETHAQHDHRLVTIFRAKPAVLEPDFTLDVRGGRARTFGLDPVAVSALHRDINIRSADLLVAHGGETLKYLAMANVQVPIIYHKIGTLGRKFQRSSSERLHRWALGHASHTIAISSQSRVEAIHALDLKPHDVSVIPNARCGHTFHAGPHNQRPRLGFVGHLSRTKRPQVFLDAVHYLRRQRLDFDAYIAGDGPLASRLTSQAIALDVDILGHVADVPRLLGSTDIFAFTSLAEGEGMPGVLIEAALSETAIVTTDVPGATDVVVDQHSGFVVPVDDRALLERRLQHLLTEPTTRREFATRAREHALNEFAIPTVAHRWATQIDRTLEDLCASYT